MSYRCITYSGYSLPPSSNLLPPSCQLFPLPSLSSIHIYLLCDQLCLTMATWLAEYRLETEDNGCLRQNPSVVNNSAGWDMIP